MSSFTPLNLSVEIWNVVDMLFIYEQENKFYAGKMIFFDSFEHFAKLAEGLLDILQL